MARPSIRSDLLGHGITITPGHWADSPQAEGLIYGLAGVGHVIADAGYDTDALRRFIAGYTLRLGEMARTGRIRATVMLTIEPRSQPAILGRLRVMPQVERIHTTSGRVDLLLQLVAGSTAELDEALDRIGALDGVRSSESLIHLATKLDRAV